MPPPHAQDVGSFRFVMCIMRATERSQMARLAPRPCRSSLFPCEPKATARSTQGPRQAPQEPSDECWVEILPVGIQLLDLTELPDALPFLHLQLTETSLLQVVMRFVPDEQ